MRDITIKPALNGYICRVGCQTVVFDSAIKLTEALSRYLHRPKDVERDFLEHALNPMDCPGEPAPDPIRGDQCCEQAAQNPAPSTIGSIMQQVANKQMSIGEARSALGGIGR